MSWRRTLNRRLPRTHALLVKVAEDAAVKAADVVRVGRVEDVAVRAVDAAPAKVGAARAKADGDLVKVGAARARVEEAHARVDGARARVGHATRRLRRNRHRRPV